MELDKSVRKPQQARSVKTKERILDAAFQLFCKIGYYNTTTNEIAKVANVSIGSLYSYFKDKDTIFFEILDRFHKIFMKQNDKLAENIDIYKTDKKEWLRHFIEGMIEVHESSKEFIKELHILCYSHSKVAEIMEKQQEEMQQVVLNFLYLHKDDINLKDIEAASIVSLNLISSVIDQIVFGKNNIDKERILQSCIDAIYKFIFC